MSHGRRIHLARKLELNRLGELAPTAARTLCVWFDPEQTSDQLQLVKLLNFATAEPIRFRLKAS